MLFLSTIREKYVRMYEIFIIELKSYPKAIRILSKECLPITLIAPSKLEAILEQFGLVLAKTNKDYDLVLTRLYLYYDMKIDNIWHRQSKKSNYSIPGICPTLYSN